MIFNETPLKGSFVVQLQPFTDERGWFARTYCKKEFETIGHTKEWVQLNHSFTNTTGTIRGMHFQLPPFSEIKMVRCIAGAVYDVIVDIRKNSPTFLQHFGIVLSAENQQMLYIPEGYAHGFQTLTKNTALLYHHSEFYRQNVEGGLHYLDKAININWPLTCSNISHRDENHAYLTPNFLGI